jgi:hypothetical protein
LFDKEKLNQSLQLKATQFANTILMNNGKGKFEPVEMPSNAQLSNYRAVIPLKYPANSQQQTHSYLLLGNFGYNNIEIGRQDADFGTILQWNKQSAFKAATLSNIPITGEVRKTATIKIGNASCWILAKNNGALQVLKIK